VELVIKNQNENKGTECIVENKSARELNENRIQSQH
jgi:hypothetical protein